MAKGKGHSQQKKIEKFKSKHPEGRKAFAKVKRQDKLNKTKIKKIKTKQVHY